METYTKNLTLWDRVMMAITFAEAGDASTARQILRKQPRQTRRPTSRPRQQNRRQELRA